MKLRKLVLKQWSLEHEGSSSSILIGMVLVRSLTLEEAEAVPATLHGSAGSWTGDACLVIIIVVLKFSIPFWSFFIQCYILSLMCYTYV